MNTPSHSTFPHAVLWHGRSITPDDPIIVNFIAEAHVAPIDQHLVRGSELKVEALAQLKEFANLSPHQSPYKLLVILEADKLSTPVANSLLKLIEEPPTHLLLRLNAERLSAVLATIKSRCQQAFIGDKTVTDDRFPWRDVQRLSLTEQFALAEKLAADDNLEAVITHWLAELEVDLLQGAPVDASIALGLELVTRLRTNANRKLALESWFIGQYHAA